MIVLCFLLIMDIWWILNLRCTALYCALPQTIESEILKLRLVLKTIARWFKLASSYKTLTDNLIHNSWELFSSPRSSLRCWWLQLFVFSSKRLLFEHARRVSLIILILFILVWKFWTRFRLSWRFRVSCLCTDNEIQIFWSISWEIVVPPATQHKNRKRHQPLNIRIMH